MAESAFDNEVPVQTKYNLNYLNQQKLRMNILFLKTNSSQTVYKPFHQAMREQLELISNHNLVSRFLSLEQNTNLIIDSEF